MERSDKPAPSNLRLIVPDSGRTWIGVMYDEINRIPPETVETGDVFIVHHPVHEGVMFMQAVRPKTNGWVLEDVSPIGEDKKS